MSDLCRKATQSVESRFDRLQSENTALKALVSELVKAAEPFVTMADDYGPFEGAEYVALQTSNVLIRVRDLRSLSEAVARAKKDTP